MYLKAERRIQMYTWAFPKRLGDQLEYLQEREIIGESGPRRVSGRLERTMNVNDRQNLLRVEDLVVLAKRAEKGR